MLIRLVTISFLLLSSIVDLLGANISKPPSPPTPNFYSPYGTVLASGGNIPVGTIISAWCSGINYGNFPAELYNGKTYYSLDVLGDDLSTPLIKEGCYLGEKVIFKIGYQTADEVAFWKNDSEEINLTTSKTDQKLYLPFLSK